MYKYSNDKNCSRAWKDPVKWLVCVYICISNFTPFCRSWLPFGSWSPSASCSSWLSCELFLSEGSWSSSSSCSPCVSWLSLLSAFLLFRFASFTVGDFLDAAVVETLSLVSACFVLAAVFVEGTSCSLYESLVSGSLLVSSLSSD